MTTATVRDLGTRFARIRQLLEQEGQIIVTDHGRPVAVLEPFHEKEKRQPRSVDYYAFLRKRMPNPITKAARRALDGAARDER